MDRRKFLATATFTTTALAISGCNDNNRVAIDYSKHPKHHNKKNVYVNKGKKTTIKLATSWPAHFPIMGEGVDEFAKRLEVISSGSLKVKIYPKNVLVPALAVFDAASSGQIDAFHSGPYYWKGKNSAFSLFSGMPFGFDFEEINSWMMYGDGLKLWRELYARYNLYPLLGGNTNIQMGGWFRKEIKTLKDMQGLKMRIPGLGGEVMAKLGVNPVLLPAGEIYTSLERGVIDATEWVGPALDIKMGFYKVAPYYYSGWHEPGSILELTFNKNFWDKLSQEQKQMIEVCSNEMNSNMTYKFHYENIHSLSKLKQNGVKLKKFPKEVTDAGKKALYEVIDELSSKNKEFKKVYESIAKHLELSKEFADISLKYFLNIR
jgi:TRAP-type mannitol/chloroaromatic compound transport system substrate-binding protein